MKQLIIAIFILSTQLAEASIACSWFFESEKNFNLSDRAKKLESLTIEEILQDPSKTWIQTRNKEYRAYKFLPGQASKPLVIFMMGLGGSIEETLHKNQVLKDYLKQKYPVLVLEGSKLGDTAILADREQFKSNFKYNMEGYEDLFRAFLANSSTLFDSIEISGHSYGAYGASHLATMIREIVASERTELARFKLTLKLFAPAVTNFNNRLNPNWMNKALKGVTNYMDLWGKKAGYNLQVKEVTKALVGSIPTLAEDPLKLQMSAELTVDAGSVHILKILKKLEPETEIQIFVGSDENVLFPMMHFELFEELVEDSRLVTFFQVQGPDHFVTDELSSKQSRSVTAIKSRTQDTTAQNYYLIEPKGQVTPGEVRTLQEQLKRSSLKLWNEFIANQEVSYIYFGPIPIRDLNSFYPSEWQP